MFSPRTNFSPDGPAIEVRGGRARTLAPMMALPSEFTDAPLQPEGATNSGRARIARAPSRRRQPQGETAAARSTGPRDVLLIGCGPLAQEAFIPVLQTLETTGQVNVRALVDADPVHRDWGQRSFPKAAAIASLDAVVAPPDALAIIASPVRLHANQSNAALKRGWHVLCAAPFASTARDGALMIATAQRHERMLAIDLAQRFQPAARFLRTLCHDHLLGAPASFEIHEGLPTPPAVTPAATKLETPDGILYELGIRPLDLATWCLGTASIRNYADDAMGGVEANAFIELAFSEGTRGTIHLSRDWPTRPCYTFVFERGIVRWDPRSGGQLTLQIASAPAALVGDLVTPLSPRLSYLTERLPGTAAQALLAEIENVLAAISRRESLRVPATESMAVLHVIEECYARRTPLAQPWLSTPEAVQARALSPPMALRRP